MARHAQAGYDRAESDVLQVGVTSEAPVPWLAGEGRLEGRVTSAAGDAIADKKVIAFSRELWQQGTCLGNKALQLDELRLWVPRMDSPHCQAGRGVAYQEEIGDEDGRIAFEGLITGECPFFSPAIGAGPFRDRERGLAWIAAPLQIEEGAVPSKAPTDMHAIKSLSALLAVLLFQGSAFAQTSTVAIVAAANSQSTDCRFTDPQQKLMGTGQFAAVDIINASVTTPALNDLLAYDSVLVWSNTDFQDSAALGDVMADYVDAGGGVVIATFANTEASTARMLLGRWQTGYEVIVPGGGSATGTQSLGVVHDPGHPVMQGVSTFSGGTSSFRPNATALTAGSSLLAEWTDGRVLVALGASEQRVDLGLYPPSSDCSGGFWTSSTDGAVLIANALSFTAGGGGGTPYCFGDGTGAVCPCGNQGAPGEGCANSTGSGAILDTSGSIVLSAGGFGLQASQVQPNAPGIFFQGNDVQNGGDGVLFGDGLLCTGTAIVRLEVTSSDAMGTAQTSVDVPAAGGVSGGDTRRYQYWYRNPNAPFGSPCGTGFNTSNGVEITWIP